MTDAIIDQPAERRSELHAVETALDRAGSRHFADMGARPRLPHRQLPVGPGGRRMTTRYIGIEKDPAYAALAATRIAQAVDPAQPPLLAL
jgi:hypothetical protein